MKEREQKRIKIGVAGAGNVAGGFLDYYSTHPDFQKEVEITKVLVQDLTKQRQGGLPEEVFTTDINELINNKKIKVVVCLTGNEAVDSTILRESMRNKKFGVTANKEVVAKEGEELLAIAQKSGVGLFFESSVVAAIQIVDNLIERLRPNQFSIIQGIVNGTTNFILTRMAEGEGFPEALSEAQKLGIAEPDPTYDIEGIDAAFKLAILSTFAFRSPVSPDSIYTEGIKKVDPRDFEYAKELGYEIKLIASARNLSGKIEAWVGPSLVDKNHMLADIHGSYNGLFLSGEPVGELKLEGEGAGSEPTVASVASDVLKAVSHIRKKSAPDSFVWGDNLEVVPFENCHNSHYIRMTVSDTAGTLGRIFTILGNHGVNINEVRQPKNGKTKEGVAEMVILTDPTEEGNLTKALDEIANEDVFHSIGSVLRAIY